MSSKQLQPEEGDHVKYLPIHKFNNPENVNRATGEVTEVHNKPKKGDPEHKTYTIANDKTGKETTYGKKNIIEILDEES